MPMHTYIYVSFFLLSQIVYIVISPRLLPPHPHDTLPSHPHTLTHSPSTPSHILAFTASQASAEIVEAQEQLESLQQSYASNKSKNVEFLMSLERLCRRLNGGRLTSCKSGKDRTSMSVTLEECSLLKQNHNLDDTAFSRTLTTLRR